MKKLTLVLVVLALTMSLQAAITSQNAYEMGEGAAWTDFSTGSVIWASWDDPNTAVRVGNSAAEGFDRGFADDGEGGSIPAAHRAQAQTFTASANCTLAAVAFNQRGGGSDGVQFSLNIFDITPTSGSATSYTPGSLYPKVLSAVFNQPEGITGSKLLVLEFDDALALTAGSIYAVEIQQIAGVMDSTGMYIVRGGGLDEVTNDGGAAYTISGDQDVNGNGIYGVEDLYEVRNANSSWAAPTLRDYGFAAYAVPEPATIAMLGLGALALLRKRS